MFPPILVAYMFDNRPLKLLKSNSSSPPPLNGFGNIWSPSSFKPDPLDVADLFFDHLFSKTMIFSFFTFLLLEFTKFYLFLCHNCVGASYF